MGNVAKVTFRQFKWVEETLQLNKDFIKSYIKESDIGYFLEVDVQYPEELHERQKNLSSFPERMKIENVEELLLDLHDNKIICYTCKKFKTTLNFELFLQNMHRFVNMNQET